MLKHIGRASVVVALMLIAAPAWARGDDNKPKPATPAAPPIQQPRLVIPDPKQSVPENSCPDHGAPAPIGLETRNGTAMVGMLSCWKADEDNESFYDLSDFYAHWSVRELPPETAIPRDYGAESSPAFIRLFVGRDLSIVGTLRIDLHDPETTFTVPLATFSYQGRVGKGQNWSTNLVSDDQSLGFFRIGPTTSAHITVSAKSTSALQVQAASTVLGVLRDLSSLASPGGALITTLNRDAIQQTGRTLDNALSSIWAQSKEESQTFARQLSEWYPGARFIIQLTVPDFVKGARDGDGKSRQLTRWYELTLSCPRRSIFSSIVECDKRDHSKITELLKVLASRISAQQVLGLKVNGGVSLQQYVGDHDWYARFLRIGDNEPGNGDQSASDKPNPDTASAADAAMASEVPAPPQPPAPGGDAKNKGGTDSPLIVPTAPAKPSVTAPKPTNRTESDYAALCSSIVNTLYEIGFSRLDAQIGLWAVITGSPDFVGLEGKFQANPRCTALLPLAGTSDRWSFAAAGSGDTEQRTNGRTSGRHR